MGLEGIFEEGLESGLEDAEKRGLKAIAKVHNTLPATYNNYLYPSSSLTFCKKFCMRDFCAVCFSSKSSSTSWSNSP